MQHPAMSPRQRYARKLAGDRFLPDPLQAGAVERAQRLYENLVNGTSVRPGFLGRWFPHRPDPPRGLYFTGGTGRGKTWLMDSFYESRPFRPGTGSTFTVSCRKFTNGSRPCRVPPIPCR